MKGQLINCQTELIRVKEYYDNYKRDGDSSLTMFNNNQEYINGLEDQLKDARVSNKIKTKKKIFFNISLKFCIKINTEPDNFITRSTGKNKIGL